MSEKSIDGTIYDPTSLPEIQEEVQKLKHFIGKQQGACVASGWKYGEFLPTEEKDIFCLIIDLPETLIGKQLGFSIRIKNP